MASLASEKCRCPDSSPATDAPPLVSEHVRERTDEKQETKGNGSSGPLVFTVRIVIAHTQVHTFLLNTQGTSPEPCMILGI